MSIRIGVFTGSRAEYGILKPLIQELLHRGFNLQLIVSGSHLSQLHGMSISEIYADGFPIDAKINILDSDGSAAGASHDFGSAVTRYGDYLAENTPDLLISLGDRLEVLAVSIACMIHNIPLAHIHGGEITTGAMDDKIRHAISKLSNFHFVAAEQFKRRLIQLGEQDDNIFNTGALALDNIQGFVPENRYLTLSRLGLDRNSRYAFVAFHAAQYEDMRPESIVDNVVTTLIKTTDFSVVISDTNSDIGSSQIREKITELIGRSPSRIKVLPSLGTTNFFNCLKHSEFAIGNSSAFVIETPSLGVLSILIGNRQSGRPLAESTISRGPTIEEIEDGIRHVKLMKIANKLSTNSPYGEPGSARRIVDEIQKLSFPISTFKRFVDFY